MPMIINLPEIQLSNGRSRLSSMIEHGDGSSQELWYEVDQKYTENLTSNKLDSFVVALLTLAMSRGEDMTLRGPISEKLFYNLTNYFIPLLKLMTPALHVININSNGLVTDGTRPAGVATGFSGGIDSFCVIEDHRDAPAGFRLSHLTFHNVGSHQSRELFASRLSRLQVFAKEMEYDLVVIDSNLRETLRHDELAKDFMTTHMQRNVSAILAMQGLFAKYIYASGIRYEDAKIFPNGVSDIDPMTVHLLSTETLECISSGCQHSRVEKTAIVSGNSLSYRALDVCALEYDGNCSVCFKCARTLLTLELLGRDHLYTSVFDLEKWRKVRPKFRRTALLSRDTLLREIKLFAVENGKLSRFERMLSAIPVETLRRLLPWGGPRHV